MVVLSAKKTNGESFCFFTLLFSSLISILKVSYILLKYFTTFYSYQMLTIFLLSCEAFLISLSMMKRNDELKFNIEFAGEVNQTLSNLKFLSI